MNLIDPATLALVGGALDAASMRHAATAQNIANASVPGARPSRVAFEEMLVGVRDSLRAGRNVAVSDIPRAELAAPALAAERIELDTEMAQLARNGLHYQALLRAFGKQLSLLSLAVSEGRR